jgi:hypothetical protein
MSGAEWLGIALVVAVGGALLYMFARLALMIHRNEEPVAGGSWGRQLFGRKQRR